MVAQTSNPFQLCFLTIPKVEAIRHKGIVIFFLLLQMRALICGNTD